MSFTTETAVTNADKTYMQLRNDIVEGRVAAGTKLSEVELSTNYCVSRAVIREAINRLMACHLVERKANVGARVVTLSPEGLEQLYQVRESLEGMAARLAAKNMTDTEIENLQHLLNTHFDQQVQTGESYYQEAGDVDFHYRIVQGSKNQHLISVLINGLYHLVRMYRVQLGMAGPRVTTAFDEHLHIVKAIANRDEELAEILMRRHILYSKNNIQTKLLNHSNLKGQ
ncbi:GntR family transcriptional regulator [Alteromonas ponticola]|uniref:GntR family transcriptional regulator n=1 Tax=Alteromonas ponticola TaxID=2720613 RepID=A0ABX1R2J0_9ALTE|nr:GntR family transcriptional regulator [Alteromonas ponticola]NMH59287.1 GntR family transcriptional regulator [Alteromonas ponticola]